jgi:eukaryotic-like serine/threonine-protein kinase
MPAPGDVIHGKYRLVRLIGDGGMGSIYEARHELLGSHVALKFLHPDLARRPNILARFLQEAQLSATLQSPHIVQVSDIGQEGSGSSAVAFLVMELLRGETLQALLDRTRPLETSMAIEIAMQMLNGLDVAHQAGVVHRDLKPENVFLVPAPYGALVKILDFGIAKLRAAAEVQEQKGLTRPGVVMGTPEYMAPEQAWSADTVDARADVYAVGVMLYEMLSGRRPVTGDDPREIAQRVVAGELASLGTLVPSLPTGLVATVHRAMGAMPEQRFPSARELQHALLPFAGTRPAAASLVGMPSWTPAPPSPSVLPGQPGSQPGHTPGQGAYGPPPYAIQQGPAGGQGGQGGQGALGPSGTAPLAGGAAAGVSPPPSPGGVAPTPEASRISVGPRAPDAQNHTPVNPNATTARDPLPQSLIAPTYGSPGITGLSGGPSGTSYGGPADHDPGGTAPASPLAFGASATSYGGGGTVQAPLPQMPPAGAGYGGGYGPPPGQNYGGGGGGAGGGGGGGYPLPAGGAPRKKGMSLLTMGLIAAVLGGGVAVAVVLVVGGQSKNDDPPATVLGGGGPPATTLTAQGSTTGPAVPTALPTVTTTYPPYPTTTTTTTTRPPGTTTAPPHDAGAGGASADGGLGTGGAAGAGGQPGVFPTIPGFPPVPSGLPPVPSGFPPVPSGFPTIPGFPPFPGFP